MDGLREQLLAGTAFAGDEYGGVGRSDSPRGRYGLFHLTRAVDELGLL